MSLAGHRSIATHMVYVDLVQGESLEAPEAAMPKLPAFNFRTLSVSNDPTGERFCSAISNGQDRFRPSTPGLQGAPSMSSAAEVLPRCFLQA
jgi:hypothetical protein